MEQCAEAERLLAALRVMAAATLEDKALWRREGFRSVAAWMASKTGTAVGPAIATMEMAGLLADLPVVAEAFLAGRLSEAQAREIAAVAAEVPGAEGQLVEAAGKLTLRSLQEECRRVEAAAAVDEDDRYRQVHRRRDIRAWVDRHNVGRMSATMTPDQLALVMGEIDRRTGVIAEGAIRGRWFESWGAHRVDALVEMALPECEAPAPPASMVHVVVDYDALVRGHTVTGERCEIPGIGPIPVTLARQMAEDCILKVLLTKGVDVMTVAHGGYTIPAHLRTALDVRDPKCIVPGCDYRRRLQKDHRNAFGRTRSPSSTTSRTSAPSTTTSRPSAATRIEAARERGNGSHPRTGTKTSPSCARSSPVQDGADDRVSPLDDPARGQRSRRFLDSARPAAVKRV